MGAQNWGNDELDSLQARSDAIKALSEKGKDYHILNDEKKQLHLALMHAVKARRDRTEPRNALQSCSDKLQQLESECIDLLKTCESDIEAISGPLDQLDLLATLIDPERDGFTLERDDTLVDLGMSRSVYMSER